MTLRRFFILFVLLSWAKWSPIEAVPSISGVSYSDVTKSGALIRWDSSAPSTQDKILFGTSTTYGYYTDGGTLGITHHNWYISGLAANQTYHFCPQSTDTSGASICDGTQNDYTLTTLSEASVLPESPQPPASIDVSMPSQTGKIWNVSSNCNDPTTGLQGALNAASLGDTIVIPAGEVCTGDYNFPPKTGTGWIVVRTSTPDSKLPAPGNRITPDQKPLLATLRTASLYAVGYANAGDSCRLYPNSTGATEFGINFKYVSQCVNGAWQQIKEVGSGPTPPSTCNTGEWFYQTNATNLEAVSWWCVAPNEWENMLLWADANPYGPGAVNFQPNAHHYRLVGLEITQIPTPTTAHVTNAQVLVYIPGNQNISNITIDRCYLHGQPYPSQTWVAIEGNANSLAVVDSYIDQISVWTPDHNAVGETAAFAILIDAAQGPGRFENNYISAYGIDVFFTDNSGASIADPTDYVIRHNYFYRDPSYMFGSPTNLGENHHYFQRQRFELKRGRRMVVEGNIFNGSWAETQGGQLFLLGPRQGAGAEPNNFPTTISDILVRDNLFENGAQGIQVFGHNTPVIINGDSAPWMMQRIQFSDNVLYNIDGKRVCPQGTYSNGNFSIFFNLGGAPEDLVLTHNTFYQLSQSIGSAGITYDGHPPGANFMVRDNVMPGNTNTIYGYGIPTLDLTWTRGSNPGWWMDHNVFFNETDSDLPAPQDKTSSYPTNNFWAGDQSTVGFGSLTSPFQLGITGGPYAGQASDGTNPGIDQAAFTAATAHTIDGQWGGTSTTQNPPGLPVLASTGPFPIDGNLSFQVQGGVGNVTTTIILRTSISTFTASVSGWSVPLANIAGLVTGTYSLTATVQNMVGTSPLLETTVFITPVLPQAPQLLGSGPWTTTGSMNFQPQPSAGDVTTSITLTGNGQTFTTSGAGWSVALASISGLVAGSYVLNATVTNVAGTSPALITTVQITSSGSTLQAPTIPVLLGSNPWAVDGTFNFQPQPSAGPITLYTWLVNPSGFYQATSSNWSVPLSSFTGLTPNTYTLAAMAQNAAGFSPAMSINIQVIASTTPTVAVTAPQLIGAGPWPSTGTLNFQEQPHTGLVTLNLWLTPLSPSSGQSPKSYSFSATGWSASLASLSGLQAGTYFLVDNAQNFLGASPFTFTIIQITGSNAAGPTGGPESNVVGASGPLVYPNPWRSDNNTGPLNFDNLRAGATVKIFTVSGHLVATKTADSSGKAHWDPAGSASGLYLYLATDDQGHKFKGKIAVLK
jgi:hypothetical protein